MPRSNPLTSRPPDGPFRPRPRRESAHPQRRSLPLFQGALRLPSTALQSPPPLTLPDTLRGHAARHPPGPRSTSFRALGYWETLSRAAARTASRTGTTSHASPTRLRDSQQPRPTRKLTPHPQCVIHRHHPPDEGEKGINIYNGRQRLAPLRVLKNSAVRVPIALFNLLKINLLMSLIITILYVVLKIYCYENTVT